MTVGNAAAGRAPLTFNIFFKNRKAGDAKDQGAARASRIYFLK